MASEPEYPKRPKVFIAKFVRLMAKTCLANELGPEAMALLTVIVATEDARGYRGPVSFWNGQLMPTIGCRCDSTFRRLRDRCERAGWLVHRPGTKWHPPTYWVTIPPQFDGWDDGPTDEGSRDYESPNSRLEQASGEQGAGERQASGVLGASERTDSFPVPVPNPVPSSAVVPPAVAAPERSEPRKPKRPRPRNPLFDAVADVTGSDAVVSGAHVGKLAAALARADPPYTPDDVREFGRRFHALCPWAAADSRDRPTIGELEKYIGKLRAAPAAPTAAASRPAVPFDPTAASSKLFITPSTKGGIT